MKAVFFRNNVDGRHFDGLRQRLEEGIMLGRDEYPLTLAHTYELIVEQYTSPLRTNTNSTNNKNSIRRTGASFAQRGNNDNDNRQTIDGRPLVAGTDGRTDSTQVCHNCQAAGHMSYTYSESDKRANNRNHGANVLQIGMLFTQSKTNNSDVINKSWVLLDTCSTDTVCFNSEYITNIKQCVLGDELRMRTNGG